MHHPFSRKILVAAYNQSEDGTICDGTLFTQIKKKISSVAEITSQWFLLYSVTKENAKCSYSYSIIQVKQLIIHYAKPSDQETSCVSIYKSVTYAGKLYSEPTRRDTRIWASVLLLELARTSDPISQ